MDFPSCSALLGIVFGLIFSFFPSRQIQGDDSKLPEHERAEPQIGSVVVAKPKLPKPAKCFGEVLVFLFFVKQVDYLVLLEYFGCVWGSLALQPNLIRGSLGLRF